MQSPSLSMTPVSIKQLKVSTRRKSGTQKAVRDNSKNCCKLDIDSNKLDLYANKHDDWNLVFAHHEEEDNTYPFTTIEIAEAQPKDRELKVYFKKNGKMAQKDIGFHFIEDTKVLCIMAN
jgi:hypothetical protein